MISKKTVKIGANNVHTGPPEHGVDGALLWEENIGLTKIYISVRCHLLKVCWSEEKCSKDGINSNIQLTDGVQPLFNYHIVRNSF